MAKRTNKRSKPVPALTPQEIHEALRKKPFSPEQQEVLAQLRWGRSIQEAMTSIGYSRSAFDRWRERDYLFRLASDCARDRYTEAIADALHQCEGYSRRLIDMAQRNEAAPLGLRVRCALAMVRRDPSQKWLPRPIEDIDPNLPRFDDFFPQDLPYPAESEDITAHEYVEREDRREAERKQLEQPRITEPMPTPPTALGIRTRNVNDGFPPSRKRKHPVLQSEQRHRETPPEARSASHLAEARRAAPMIAPGEVSIANESPGRGNASEARPPRPHAALKAARATQHAALELPGERLDTPSTATALHTHNLHTSTTQTTESTSTKYAPERAPEFIPNTHTQRLDTVFLNHYTIHRHETAEDFAKLHAEIIRAYEPETPREELTVLRITQKHWALRRIDTFEMAISESIVNQTRQYHPDANGHAAIALKFLEENPSLEVRFFDRMRDYRNHHEKSLERLDNLYERIHHNRTVRESQKEPIKAIYNTPSPLADLEECSQ